MKDHVAPGTSMKTIRELVSKLKQIVKNPRFPERAGIVVGLAVLIVYFFQLRVMQQQVKLAERAWIGYVLPANFPLEGATTPATLQVTNFGKPGETSRGRPNCYCTYEGRGAVLRFFGRSSPQQVLRWRCFSKLAFSSYHQRDPVWR